MKTLVRRRGRRNCSHRKQQEQNKVAWKTMAHLEEPQAAVLTAWEGEAGLGGGTFCVMVRRLEAAVFWKCLACTQADCAHLPTPS